MIGAPMETKGINANGENKAKPSRKEIIEKKKAMDALLKAASSEKDHLFAFPAFRRYQANGLSALLESGRGDKLSSSLKHYIQNLLKANMEGLYGSEWLVEEKVKRREMVAPEARYIFVREASNASASEMLTMSEQERTSASCVEERGPMVGYIISTISPSRVDPLGSGRVMKFFAKCSVMRLKLSWRNHLRRFIWLNMMLNSVLHQRAESSY